MYPQIHIHLSQLVEAVRRDLLVDTLLPEVLAPARPTRLHLSLGRYLPLQFPSKSSETP
jgi:hypothetical protein